MATKPINKLVLTAISGTILISCAATQVVLEHRKLEVSSQQSETIFLDPVPASEKSLYVSIKNTSDQTLNITPDLNDALRQKGYRIVTNPEHAHYHLQANVLTIRKMSLSASQSALGKGYGSAISGALTGAAAGSLTHHGYGMIGGGLAGGMIGLAADSLVKAVNYTMITDIQISEKINKNNKLAEKFRASLTNGSASVTEQIYTKESHYQRYRTRLVSNANQVNLSFEKARPLLEKGLVQSLAGLF